MFTPDTIAALAKALSLFVASGVATILLTWRLYRDI